MRSFKGIQSAMSFDGNQDTSFGKDCDVTELSVEPGYKEYWKTQFTVTIRDEDYKEVKLTMDMRLLSQILQMLGSDLDYHDFDERDCQQLHELAELIVKMKQAEVPA